MVDLIDRSMAIDALGERPMVWTGSDYELGARNQYDADVLALETVPTAERKGHWKNAYALTEYRYRCSECFANHRARYDYCPSCGARMESEE